MNAERLGPASDHTAALTERLAAAELQLRTVPGRLVGSDLADLLHEAQLALQIPPADRLQQILGAIITSSDDAILSTNLDGIVTSWNIGAQTLFGYSADEMVGQSLARLMTAEKPDEHVHLLAQIARGQNVRHYETSRRRKDGSTIIVSITMSPIFDSQGDVIGVSKISRDMTEFRRTQSSLMDAITLEQRARADAEALQKRLTFLLEASSILASTPNYQQRLEQLTELVVPTIADWCAVDVIDSKQMLHRVAVKHIDPHKSDLLFHFLERFPPLPNRSMGILSTAHTGKATLIQNAEHLRQVVGDDAERLAMVESIGLTSLIIVPLLAFERVLGVLTIATTGETPLFQPADLEMMLNLASRSAQLIENAQLYEQAQQLNAELETRVRERTAQLEATNQALEAFSYSVSHDLRTPLRAIDGFARMVIRDYGGLLPDDGQRRLNVIRDNAQQMGVLIDDLLRFSRLNRLPLSRQTVNMTDLVQHALDNLSSEHQNRQVDFIIEPLPDASGDPILLLQVLVNLLSNAIKYTRPRDRAQIVIGYLPATATTTGTYFIRDNGVGFDMQYSDKLFGVFQRLHHAEAFEGTGVGLAIVQRVIQRHGGQVWATAEPDRGATFFFTLEGKVNHES